MACTAPPFFLLRARPLAVAFAAACAGVGASAQDSTATATQLAPVTVSGRAPPRASVAGWDVPLADAPVDASIYPEAERRDTGVERLSDLKRIDPAVSDAYNAQGYIDYLTVRGFVLDNRFNYRRDGLPINAETSIPLENKARVEVLKGTSGIEAGTSAPGGLVNFVVKRPTAAPLRSAYLEWREAGSVLGAVDLSQRFGPDDAFGLRLNVAAEHLDPLVHDARGNRNLFALAGDWRLGHDTLLEAEIEQSHRSQPSVPGFSLLGNTVPAPVDPRINLNNQPWTEPNVFDATTASLRWQQQLSTNWRFIAHAGTQRLMNDDRTAFPFGCTDPNGTYYADRYCPDGTFDLYDFRSEHEHRRQNAIDLSLQGRFATGPVRHAITGGVLRSTVRNRFEPYAYNYTGTGNVDGTAVTPGAPDPLFANTNRDERSTELYLRDALRFGDRLTTWLGVRHTRISRQSIATDGTGATDYAQTFTTPFAAVSYALAPDRMVYASWGRGVESEVAPNLPGYTNAGQALPALESRQAEVGLKGGGERATWSLAWFDIVRPVFADVGACDLSPASCTHQLDGNARHRGIEASGTLHEGRWDLAGGLQYLHARRAGSQDANLNGLRPPNVPAFAVKLLASYRVPTVAGLALQGGIVHESSREVLPDNSASIPGYTVFDAGTRYDMKRNGHTWTLRAGIDNLFDKHAWRESPYQFAHAYLFPLQPRTVRLSLQVDL